MYNYNNNYNHDVYGRGINEDEYFHSDFQEQKFCKQTSFNLFTGKTLLNYFKKKYHFINY